MRKALLHETLVLLVLLAVAGIVFYETRDIATASPGQVAPATFPRLAASALALLAAIKLLLMFLRPAALADGDYDWSWANARKPVLAILLLLGFFLLFRSLPFPLLTALMVGLLFWAFGVTPFKRLVVGTVLATSLLCGIFIFLMRIPI